MSRITPLVNAYRDHLAVPWQVGLAAIQRVIFAVYDKADELRLRAHIDEFALATQQAGKQWLPVGIPGLAIVDRGADCRHVRRADSRGHSSH